MCMQPVDVRRRLRARRWVVRRLLVVDGWWRFHDDRRRTAERIGDSDRLWQGACDADDRDDDRVRRTADAGPTRRLRIRAVRRVMHRARLSGREIPAALVEIGSRERAVAQRQRRGSDRRRLTGQDGNREGEQPRSNRAHRSAVEVDEAASRVTWIDAVAEAPLVQAVTTPSPATASAGYIAAPAVVSA